MTGGARAFLPPVAWTSGDGVLLEPTEAEGFEVAARAGGLGFARHGVEGLVLYTHAPSPSAPGRPIPARDLRVTASLRTEQAALAVDGDPATRWGTGRPQRPGDWLRVDLAAPRRVQAVRLWTTNRADWPRGLRLDGSADGDTWQPLDAQARTSGPHRWGGIALLRDGIDAVRLDLAPAVVRALRVTLTRGDPVVDWSVHELTVYAAD